MIVRVLQAHDQPAVHLLKSIRGVQIVFSRLCNIKSNSFEFVNSLHCFQITYV